MRLWPFALTYTAYSWNVLPNGVHGLNPIEIYRGTKIENNILRSEKIWRCPSCVLDPKLQEGKNFIIGVHEPDEDNN